MTERPILMSAPNVRSILSGAKTQTRRVVKPQPPDDIGLPIRCEMYAPTVVDRYGDEQPGADIFGAYSNCGEWGVRCPFGAPGHHLWVREAWRVGKTHDAVKPSDLPHERGLTVAFAAGGSRAHGKDGTYVNDDTYPVGRPEWLGKLRPGIFLPRWASRITLEITEVRVERLQEISVRDAHAEGIPPPGPENPDDVAINEYRALWESINGAGSWAANPWVWIIEFKRVQ